ncbi:hypothetical protein CU669_18890 [Paramagnetospirillum kuznetsovii]|uniref:High-affinity zinc uptake system protein ZnuA n=1 Tax=Paramagnetospirillum kuznetsovii TaxID=2053833 RepID=A0A364NTS9_9PROT|nr:metal ABC transporter substrate-binding protein [Paramagnetospirillum kuznetsovii]RAU20315.1 hypothetical protein CU669_18890 [Paramagnetospirillum kuznetsovii]
MLKFKLALFATLTALSLLSSASTSLAAEPRVVASLPPIHSLVSRLLQGVAKPELLMTGRVADHLVELSATQIQALRQADLVVWSGAELEGAIAEAEMVQPTLSNRLLTLSDKIPMLPITTAGNPDRPSGRHDLRFWLDPRLVHHAVHMMVPTLVRLYPNATDRILDNEIALIHDLHHVEHSIHVALKTPDGTPLHVGASDLRYLEWRFNLAQQGCARNGFDPVGFNLAPGSALYGQLMDGARDALLACQNRKVASAAP